MTRLAISVPLLAYACFCGTSAYARTSVQRDVEGYAIATCLAEQSEPYLKDQGDAWASVIVQRSHGAIELYEAPVRAAIDGAIKKLAPAYRRAKDSP